MLEQNGYGLDLELELSPSDTSEYDILCKLLTSSLNGAETD